MTIDTVMSIPNLSYDAQFVCTCQNVLPVSLGYLNLVWQYCHFHVILSFVFLLNVFVFLCCLLRLNARF